MPHHAPTLHRVSRAFPRSAASAAAARRFVRGALRTAPVAVDDEIAVLLANELVTNAIRHTTVNRFEVSVLWTADGVQIEVADDEPAAPVVTFAGPEDSSGRGMAMVATLAERWGVYRGADERKRIWFRLEALPTPG